MILKISGIFVTFVWQRHHSGDKKDSVVYTGNMKDYAKLNKVWWDAVTPIHASSDLYDLKSFKKGNTSLFSVELNEMGDVKEKKLLHLMCHFGMDTLSWAREGADVTGVDISDQSISFAKKISAEMHIPARFICSDLYELNNVLNEEFDIIFMSYGVLCWLSSLKKWSELLRRFLKKGGMFYITEIHPFTTVLNYKFQIEFDYFDKGPHVDDSPGTYSDWDADIQGTTYIWFHPLSSVINAIINAKFDIEFVHEFPYTMYEQFPGKMKKDSQGRYFLKDTSIQIPLLFSLKAINP